MGNSDKELGLTLAKEGLKWPPMPVFSSLEEERLHRKQRLAAAYRIFALHGLESGIGGHITVRDPILKDHFWVNPLGVHFGRITVSDLVLVDHDGHIKEGKHTINAAAYAIHSSVHQLRPDVIAAAHSHSRFSTAFATLGRTLPPISQEACSFYEDHALYDGYDGVAASDSEASRIANALGSKKAVICRNHGVFTVGHSLEESVFWFIRMERAFEQFFLASSVGVPIEIDHETASLACQQVGSHLSGWYSLTPLMEKVLIEQPDLLN
ncbi:MAG: class II aldolase/adducin family protein [Betaproteobacteria bacterium]